MSMEYKSAYCQRCDEPRKVERPAVNHLLHLVLSILTGGVWVIVWIGVSVRVGGWRCSHCGVSVSENWTLLKGFFVTLLVLVGLSFCGGIAEQYNAERAAQEAR